MVNSFAQDGGRRRDPDALERDDEDAGTDALRAGCRGGAVHDDRAVPALRDQSCDGEQVAQAVSRARGAGSRGSLAGSSAQPTPNPGGDRGDDCRGSPTPPQLGSPQTDPVAAEASTKPDVAGTQHCRRHLEAAGPDPVPSPPSPPASPRPRPDRGLSPQPSLDGRLQGPISNSRRSLLLPPDRRRPLQSLPAGLPISALRRDHLHQEELPAPL